MKKLEWLLYGTDYVLRKKLKKKYPIPYCKRQYLHCEEANNILYELIKSDQSFFAGRFGFFEMAAMRAYEFEHKDKYDIVMKQIYDCAGFFPYDISLGYDFLHEMKKSMTQVDVLLASNELAENYFINHYLPKNVCIGENFNALHPWEYSNPWSEALAGKKVLVVHPFEESIREQYLKREELFIGTNVLPQFKLLTYKALQTTGDFQDSRFHSWFDALDFMFDDIRRMEFDIALLGCGAYGFPLGARIKEMGKQAIQMGGVLQLLFGIMGKRWDGTAPNCNGVMQAGIAPYYNDSWIYPNAKETPAHAKNIEYGPYWK